MTHEPTASQVLLTLVSYRNPFSVPAYSQTVIGGDTIDASAMLDVQSRLPSIPNPPDSIFL